jgi:quercetin dioxygenase-like cupin family protein
MSMQEWGELKKLIEYPSAGILSRDMKRSGGGNVSLFCMAKGTEMGDHTSPMKATVNVIEGSGTFTLSGKDLRMGPGTVIVMKKNEMHSIKARENTSFMLSLHK